MFDVTQTWSPGPQASRRRFQKTTARRPAVAARLPLNPDDATQTSPYVAFANGTPRRGSRGAVERGRIPPPCRESRRFGPIMATLTKAW